MADESRIPGGKVGKTAEEVEAKVDDETGGSGAEMEACETIMSGKKEETPPGGKAPVITESATIWQSGESLGCVLGCVGVGGRNGPVITVGAGIGVRKECLGSEVPWAVWLSGFDLMSLGCGLTVTLGFSMLIVEEENGRGGGAGLCVGVCRERSALSSKRPSESDLSVDESETDCSCGRAGSSIVPFALILWGVSVFSDAGCGGSTRYQKRRTLSNPSRSPIRGLYQARRA